MELEFKQPEEEGQGAQLAAVPALFADKERHITAISEEEIFKELGFTPEQGNVLLGRLQNFSTTIKREAFEARIENHPLILEREADIELNNGVSVNKEARILGEAVFWAYLAEHDPGLCENVVEFNALSPEQYKVLEHKIERFLQSTLFANESPCLLILQGAKNGEAKELQMEFLQGLIDPFVRCYDDITHKHLIEKISDWFDRLTFPRAPGLIQLELTPNEERVIQEIKPRKPVVDPESRSRKMSASCKRINILLDTLQDDSAILISSLFDEIKNGISLDEATFERIVAVCAEKIDWGRNEDKELMRSTHQQMKDRGIGSWTQGDGWHSFQLAVLLDALLSVKHVLSPDFSIRMASKVEAAFRASTTHKNESFKSEYLSDLHRYISALLVEKDALAK